MTLTNDNITATHRRDPILAADIWGITAKELKAIQEAMK
jgi:hypothetical protein